MKTILFVQVIPWLVVTFVSALIPMLLIPMFLRKNPAVPWQIMAWYPLLMSLVATILYLGKDIFFSIWARRKLYSEFRERASQPVSPVAPAPPPEVQSATAVAAP
jgi:hypothetical protein